MCSPPTNCHELLSAFLPPAPASHAGHLELQATSLLLERNICIYQSGQPVWRISNFDKASMQASRGPPGGHQDWYAVPSAGAQAQSGCTCFRYCSQSAGICLVQTSESGCVVVPWGQPMPGACGP